MNDDIKHSFNIKKESELQRLGDLVLTDIDKNAQRTMDDGHRNHLGGSMIGDTCRRKLWYSFRWCGREIFDGRKLRLFDRGHREEIRNTLWLRQSGFTVWDVDESQPKKANGQYPQFRISGCGGHFGGSLDGIIQFPEHYGPLPYMLLEYKTNGTGAGFNNLYSGGMPKEKPVHWAQVCTYGYKMGLDYVLYVNTCKNDDMMFVRPYKLDKDVGRHMEDKAEKIILAREAPSRLSDNPTNYQCKACAFNKICHTGELPEINCRSCKHSVPVDGAQWHCEIHQAVIPKEIIPEACAKYEPITVC